MGGIHINQYHWLIACGLRGQLKMSQGSGLGGCTASGSRNQRGGVKESLEVRAG